MPVSPVTSVRLIARQEEMSRSSTSSYLRQGDRAISRATASGNSRLMSVEHHVKGDEHFKEASSEMRFGVESCLPHLTLSAQSFFISI